MDIYLPADFHSVHGDDACGERSADAAYVENTYDDAMWLGGEALVAPLPLRDVPERTPRATAARRTPVDQDPTWRVV
jgi:hypothetical protein